MIHDIKNGRRALSSTSRVGLGPQAAIYLRCGPWKAEALEDENDVKGHVDAARIDRSKLLRYNAEDCVRTAQIRSHHVREFREDPADRARLARIYAQQIRLAQLGSEMHLKGFPVDKAERHRLSKELLRLGRERGLELHTLVRKRAPKFRIFNKKGLPTGPNESDLRALLFEECAKPGIEGFGLQVPISDKSRTETGAVSVDKDALLYLFQLDNTPDEAKAIIRACWKADAPWKARSTFVVSDKVKDAIGPDGRMHAGINTDGTETGRWSCSNPNLFNLSETQKEDEGSLRGDIPNVRSMYVAPPGYVVVHRDFKQLELEVMAEYTGDVALRRMLNTGDAHTARVHEWFGVPVGDPVPKMVRRQGKVVGFASQYGAGIETVYMKVLEQIQDARYEEIAALRELFPEKHPGIAKHWETSLEFAEQHGYSEAPIMNWRRYYPPGMPLKPTETSNYAIQGGAGAIANSVMVGREKHLFKQSLHAKLQRYFPRAWLAMHVYDSFDVICPKAEAASVDRMMEECMAGPWQIGAKAKMFGSDGKIGQRWSDV